MAAKLEPLIGAHDPLMLDLQGALAAARGDFKTAVERIEAAMARAQALGAEDLLPALRMRLGMYREEKVYMR